MTLQYRVKKFSTHIFYGAFRVTSLFFHFPFLRKAKDLQISATPSFIQSGLFSAGSFFLFFPYDAIKWFL